MEDTAICQNTAFASHFASHSIPASSHSTPTPTPTQPHVGHPDPMTPHRSILESLSRYTHQLPEPQILYARALYLNGSLDAAARKVADALRRCPDDATAPRLLAVSIFLRQGRGEEAAAALEAAVAVNFGIREAPLYHIVHAQVGMRWLGSGVVQVGW